MSEIVDNVAENVSDFQSVADNLVVKPSIQVIDEDKKFNPDLLPYIQKFYSTKKHDNGLNYHIVSVFGSQSTGKSTLLNTLFGTKFDVMNEVQRQQTTKGIWLSHANFIASSDDSQNNKTSNDSMNLFVMDVEGTDGRERGEDQDFERKSALFALSTSEVLIVNIWEHQVGLYNGANMGLLKTVFEVNLSLFASNRQKCLLLFVIRDHVGVTPLENLSATLTSDLIKIWDQLNKPESCEDLKLSDFFDLKFFALSHKVLQPEKFEKDVQLLGDEFSRNDTDNILFLDEYHRHIPIDGWTVYSEQVWEQIELNKDLDLPTQQILVARFRCDEILQQAYDEFLEKFGIEKLDSIVDPSHLSQVLKKLRTEALATYDLNGSRYNHTVYSQRRVTLLTKVDSKLKEVYDLHINRFYKDSITQFQTQIVELKKSKKFTNNFKGLLNTVSSDTLDHFQSKLKTIDILDDETKTSVFNHTKELGELTAKIDELCEENKLKEKDLLSAKIVKKFSHNFKEIVVATLNDPSSNSWDLILDNFYQSFNSLLNKKYLDGDSGEYDFQLGLSSKLNQETFKDIEKSMWRRFYDIIHDYISEDTVSRIIRNKFEDLFRYDEDGIPKLWKNVTEIDLQFNKSKAQALSVLPVLSLVKLEKTGSELIPDSDIFHDEYDDEEDEEDGDEESGYKSHNFSHLLSSKQQQNINSKVKKEMDAVYIEAKRSIINNTTSIPVWMYGLLVILGWNEFMTVLRNPFLFTLALLSMTGLYFAYNTKMLGPIISVLVAMFDETKKVAKDKLKEFVLDDHEKIASVPAASSKVQENIPLDDLNEKGETI